MLSREKVETMLRQKGVDLQKLAGDPAMVERAVGIAYKAIPIPWRWVVGRKRVHRAVSNISARVPASRPF
jgi:hypothetical protein